MTDESSDHETPASPRTPSLFRPRRRFTAVHWALALCAVVGGVIVAVAYWVYPGIVAARTADACTKHLKMIGLAFHNYADEYRCFPPAFVRGSDGEPAHSWRVLLLPFLGRTDLYDAYRFDEPWNSPSNLRVAEQMPEVFGCPGDAGRRKGTTNYVAVIGSQTVWRGDQSVRFAEILDGTANTILLIETADSDIGWTEPRDVQMAELFPPDIDGVGDRFNSRHGGVKHVLTCDGAVKRLPVSPDEGYERRLLYTLLTAYRGEPFGGKWLPGEEPLAVEAPGAAFPPEREAAAMRTTDVLPHTADPIREDRNYVYCATGQLAWDDFRQSVGGDLKLEGDPPLAARLNGPAFPRESLSSDSYVARMGECPGVRDRIMAEMQRKFPEVEPNLLSAGNPLGVISYAFLQKNLPFKTRFDRDPEPLVFHGASGDAKVRCFGFKELAKAKNHSYEPGQQVDVLHYVSDDEFIIRLKPKSDEIVLAKIRPAATLAETLQAARALIRSPTAPVTRPTLEDKEKLLVPCLAMNVLRNYDELKGRRLLNEGHDKLVILGAKQSVRFLLNERGARVESEMVIDGVYLNGHKPPPPPPPRHFVLDRPFLVYLKETNAEQPYLAIWVANAELMERRD